MWCVVSGGGLPSWLLLVGAVLCGVCFWVRVVIGLLFCSFGVRSCVRLCLVKGCWAKVSVGVCGCLGAGCVVRGGVLPVWLGGAVAGGGVGVSFDVGSRVFVLSGVSVPAPSCGVSGSSGAVVSGSGCDVVSSVGSVPASGSVVSSVVSVASVSAPSCGGVRVCVPCAVRAFGDGWCFLVLRRWARAAGVDGARVSGLLSSSVDCVPGFGSLSAGSAPVSGSVPVSSAPVSGGSVSVSGSSRVGRVGVGFGARMRDWGARVGVGGGVVSGGGVVASWWARARGRVRALASSVGVWGLVLAGVVCALVLVSVLVCFL